MKLLETIYNGFVKFFGDLKVFKFPMFIVYDPGSYRVKGEDIREVINLVKPGDILVRGYVNYLDGYVIPGFFSHAGLYLGPVAESDSQNLTNEQLKDFKAGEQMVIHAMAEGVFMEDVINFCRCDFMLILRRDHSLETEESQKITFKDVFKLSLENLGKEYDFRFDFDHFNKLSCTELVYVCCKGFLADYNVTIRTKRVLGMKKRLIAPDDFVRSKLPIVWKSKSVTDARVQKIKNSK